MDKSFVVEIASKPDDRMIVRSIIELARNLGLQTVAEGVEDSEVLEMLATMGCEAVQGYHIARPAPP